MQALIEKLGPSSTLAEWQAAAARNNARYWDWGSGRAGGRVLRKPGFWAADPGSPNPFPNSATLLDPLTESREAETLAELARFYRAGAGGPWLIWSAWDTPDLSRFGLQFAGQPPLMIRWPWEAPAGVTPAELEIVEVIDTATLNDWMAVLINGYPAPEMVAPGARPWFDARVLGGPYRLWVGYVNRTPVSCAAALTDDSATGVYAVATLPPARGRGYGAALTEVAASVDPALPAWLSASGFGEPVYRRLGFREIGRFTLWAGSR
jgi:GNAT superfamily N-acetyltransferase